MKSVISALVIAATVICTAYAKPQPNPAAAPAIPPTNGTPPAPLVTPPANKPSVPPAVAPAMPQVVPGTKPDASATTTPVVTPAPAVPHPAVPFDANVFFRDKTTRHFADPIDGKYGVVDDKTVYSDHKGRRFYFISDENRKQFEAAPDSAMKKMIMPAYIKGVMDGHLMARCPVTDSLIHVTDQTVNRIHLNRRYFFSDGQSAQAFEADPAKYLIKVHPKMPASGQAGMSTMTTKPGNASEPGLVAPKSAPVKIDVKTAGLKKDFRKEVKKETKKDAAKETKPNAAPGTPSAN